jgi:hypothetical protein
MAIDTGALEMLVASALADCVLQSVLVVPGPTWGPRLPGFQDAVCEIKAQRRRQQYHQTRPIAVVACETGADEQPDTNGDAHARTGAGASAVK